MIRSSHHFIRRTKHAAALCLHGLTLFCVAVSLWRAPLPWLHCHVAQESDAKLAEHIANYANEGVDDASDWHLHLVLLRDLFRGGPAQAPTEDPPVPLDDLLAEPFDEDFTRCFDHCGWLPVVEHGSVFDGQRLLTASFSRQRRQFFSDFAESRRLQRLLCIARC